MFRTPPTQVGIGSPSHMNQPPVPTSTPGQALGSQMGIRNQDRMAQARATNAVKPRMASAEPTGAVKTPRMAQATPTGATKSPAPRATARPYGQSPRQPDAMRPMPTMGKAPFLTPSPWRG